VILGTAGIREAYETGRGRVRVRARAHTEPLSHGKEAIIVTELPFMVKKGGDSGLIRKIADLVHDKKITEISDLRDETDRKGMRIVIELKRGVIPKVVLNKLYKHTAMQTTFGVNAVALVDNVPRTLPLRSIIHNYVQHQREVIVRRSKFELRKLEARKHILEGHLIALDNLDAVIALIRAAADRDSARSGLMEQFGLSYIQAQAILELRLQQLTALESDQIRREHSDVVERITELRTLLGDEGAVLSLIKEELAEIAERYGDDRRTQITFAEDDLDIEDLIADQQMVITITKSGYIKSLPLATYRQQRRGGVGVTGMGMKDEDYIEHLFVCSTHDYLLFFTNKGKVYRSKVYDLPDAPSRQSKGRHLGNVLPLREGERVQSVLATRDYSEAPFLLFATRRGIVKKTELQTYNTPIKADGIIAINIRDNDELVAVRRVDVSDEVIMVSKAGLTVRFAEDATRSMGRDTSGVRGMDVGADGEVIAMDVARDDQYLLVVTDNGFGKRTLVADYRKTSRGAKGVKTIQQTEAKGALAAALVVRDHHQLLFISEAGMVQRIAVRELRPLGRNAQGFRLMNVRDDDLVSAVALVVESAAETSAAVADDGPVSIDASGMADETALDGEGVMIGDPDDDALLDVPEVSADEMPDSDLEE
jgi:DNA gyrase subunit A